MGSNIHIRKNNVPEFGSTMSSKSKSALDEDFNNKDQNTFGED